MNSNDIIKRKYLQRKQSVEKLLLMIKGLQIRMIFLNYGSKDILWKIAKAVKKKNVGITAVMQWESIYFLISKNILCEKINCSANILAIDVLKGASFIK